MTRDAILRHRPPRQIAFWSALVIALYLEARHLPGWGLFLFVAIIEWNSEPLDATEFSENHFHVPANSGIRCGNLK